MKKPLWTIQWGFGLGLIARYSYFLKIIKDNVKGTLQTGEVVIICKVSFT